MKSVWNGRKYSTRLPPMKSLIMYPREESRRVRPKAIIYIEEASGNVFKRVTQPIAWSVTALSATVTVVAGIGGAAIQAGAGFVASGRSFSPLYQLDVKCA